MAGNKGKEKSRKPYINLLERNKEEDCPELVIYAVDRNNKAIKSSKINDKGEFELADEIIKKSHQIIIGPELDDLSDISREQLVIYRSSQFSQLINTERVIDIPRFKWFPWIIFRRCVSGSVRHCHPYPWLIRDNFKLPQVSANIRSFTKTSRISETVKAELSDAVLAYPRPPLLQYHCHEVCDGIVEVYRRTCCCEPWIVYDPRLDDLLRELEDLVEVFPPDPWPPIPEPGPDPAPVFSKSIINGGTINERTLHANQDLQALRSLSSAEIPAYINARPYLFCHCGSATKVAQGFIQPNGEFTICWSEWPRLLPVNCHEEYAYVVKQAINSSTVTIYDGVAANKWFHYNDFAKLLSYHFRAQSCRHNDFPEPGAFVLLQDIGNTPSYHLKTPDAKAWDRVDPPVYNDGLAYPAANAAAAKGKYLDRNWGGSLSLRYYFSEEMKALGAKYYRISVIASDASGNPTGDRTYLSPGEWRYYEQVGTELHVKKTSLGPNSAGSQNDLYEIPYDADRAWQSGQYHAAINTTDFNHARHLIMVEVFNNSGQLLRPTGTADPGGSTEAAFTFRRWYQETGPTAEVPYAALTHMFWWDNRQAKAEIVDLRVNSSPNTAECQFLVAAGDADFSVGYRAYHEQPMFLLDHRVWWRRGLGGPTGILTSPHPNPDNVGVPPAPAHQSGSNDFSAMLAGLANPKCSFTVNLHVNAKTFNGFGTLNHRDDWDQAAFALEMIP